MTNAVARLTDMLHRHHRAVVLAVCLLTLAAGAGFTALRGNTLAFWDEGDYYAYATHLSDDGLFSRDGVAPSAWWPPGYPMVLAAGRLIGLEIPGLRFLNFVALAAGILLLSRLLAIISGPVAAALGALFAFAYPILFFAAGTLYPQTITFAILAGTLCLIARCERQGRMRWTGAVLIGVLLGFATLTITVFAVVVAMTGLYLGFRSRLPNRLRAAAIVVLAAVVVVFSWTIRNTVVMGAPVLISTNGGMNLLMGNAPATTPFTGTDVDLSAFESRVNDPDEVIEDRNYRTEALSQMKQFPGRTIRMYVLKFLNFFNFSNQLVTPSQLPSLRDLLMLLTYGPLLLLAVLRVSGLGRRPVARFEWLLVSVYVGAGLFYAVFFTRIRFRLPFEIVPISLAALVVADWLRSSQADPQKVEAR